MKKFILKLLLIGIMLMPSIVAFAQLDPPSNLTATVVNNDVLLNWVSPGDSLTGEWIYWDAQINSGGGGLANGGSFYSASRWEPADLAPYDGQTVSKLSLYAYGDSAAIYELYVWTGSNAGTQVLAQAVTTFDVDKFNIIDLDAPFAIDASDELWFGYMVTHDAGTTPAGRDAGPAVMYKGDMMSLDGSDWFSLGSIGADFNWNLAAYVDDTDSSPAKPMVKAVNQNVSTGSFITSESGAISKNFSPIASKDLIGFNVYRDGVIIANTTDTTHTDLDLTTGYYEYYVTAVYDEGESEPSNMVEVVLTTIGENTNHKIDIYPNPATDVVNIKAESDINTIRAYSYTGQLVAEEKVNNGVFQFNTSQFNHGLYILQIETRKGTINRRIIIE